jgi:hypothetical protein
MIKVNDVNVVHKGKENARGKNLVKHHNARKSTSTKKVQQVDCLGMCPLKIKCLIDLLKGNGG